MEYISLPKDPKIIKSSGNEVSFEIDNLYPGYGVTLGNALRRVLLSSLPGVAITQVKIKGVNHEFSVVPHVLENVVDILLNLKQVRLKIFSDGPVKMKLKIKGDKKVVAGDIECPSQAEIVNKDAYIASITDKKGELEMELIAQKGTGYVPVEQRKNEKPEVGFIAIDAIFSPIRKINYEVENMRVGERTDYNKLILSIETDGTISAEEAFLQAAKILVDQFFHLTKFAEKKVFVKNSTAKSEKNYEEEGEQNASEKLKISDMNLSARVISSLEEANIKTLGKLLKKNENDLLNFPGLGEKAVKEIKKEIGKLGFTLKSKE